MQPLVISEMTIDELKAGIAEIEEKIPGLRAAAAQTMQAVKDAREVVDQAQKALGLAASASSRAGGNYSFARERQNAMMRELADLEYQKANQLDYPVVHSKIHGAMRPVKSRW